VKATLQNTPLVVIFCVFVFVVVFVVSVLLLLFVVIIVVGHPRRRVTVRSGVGGVRFADVFAATAAARSFIHRSRVGNVARPSG